MADYKKKNVKQKEEPRGRYIGQVEDPDRFYGEYPAWGFRSCDQKMWGFTQEVVGDLFWTEVLPFLRNTEMRTWNDILVSAKKQNHSIEVDSLNPIAQRRLIELMIEQESIISLRINGTHRLYGYHVGRVFNILWFDQDHGDNDKCVCRSKKKHT